MDRNLNNLLKWSIENSAPSNATAVRTAPDSAAQPQQQQNGGGTNGADGAPASNVNPELLAALFGGPSEAELMKAAMDLITNTSDASVTLDDRLIAFDNLEQLIESLDNANNLENLSLWTPLLALLGHEERELRRMAAWCVGTAVQNNVRTQERLLAMGGIPQLVRLATHDGEHEAVRRKAIYALSSAVRNYQPAMNVAAEELRKKGHEGVDEVDASDMDAIDEIMNQLKKKASATPAPNGTA